MPVAAVVGGGVEGRVAAEAGGRRPVVELIEVELIEVELVEGGLVEVAAAAVVEAVVEVGPVVVEAVDVAVVEVEVQVVELVVEVEGVDVAGDRGRLGAEVGRVFAVAVPLAIVVTVPVGLRRRWRRREGGAELDRGRVVVEDRDRVARGPFGDRDRRAGVERVDPRGLGRTAVDHGRERPTVGRASDLVGGAVEPAPAAFGGAHDTLSIVGGRPPAGTAPAVGCREVV